MERNVEILDEDLEIIFENLKGTDWFVNENGIVFVDYKYDMKYWDEDKKIIMRIKGGG